MGVCPSFLLQWRKKKRVSPLKNLSFFYFKMNRFEAGQFSSHWCRADSSYLKWPPLWLMQPTVSLMLKQYIVLHYQGSSARKHMQIKKKNNKQTRYCQFPCSIWEMICKYSQLKVIWKGAAPPQYEMFCKNPPHINEKLAEYGLDMITNMDCAPHLLKESKRERQWSVVAP